MKKLFLVKDEAENYKKVSLEFQGTLECVAESQMYTKKNSFPVGNFFIQSGPSQAHIYTF